jgi:hypothetical protein
LAVSAGRLRGQNRDFSNQLQSEYLFHCSAKSRHPRGSGPCQLSNVRKIQPFKRRRPGTSGASSAAALGISADVGRAARQAALGRAHGLQIIGEQRARKPHDREHHAKENRLHDTVSNQITPTAPTGRNASVHAGIFALDVLPNA